MRMETKPHLPMPLTGARRSAVARLDTALPPISSAQASAQEIVSEGVLLRK